MNFVEDMAKRMLAVPERIAIRDDNRTATYEDLVGGINAAGCAFVKQGIKAGDRVVILMNDSIEWCEIFFGLSAIGAVTVLINPKIPSAVRKNMLESADVRAVVYNSSEIPTDELRAEISAELIDATTLSKELGVLTFHQHDKDEQGLWVSSSGSTGRSLKFVMHRHSSLYHATSLNVNMYRFTENSITFSNAKLSFQYGLLLVLGVLWQGGCAILTQQLPARQRVLDTIRSNNVTHFATTPTIIYSLNKQPGPCDALAGLDRIACGGEPLSQAAEDKFEEIYGRKIYNCLGMAELLTWCICETHDAYKKYTIGMPIPEVQVKVVNIGDPDPTVGELYVRSPAIAIGYFNAPEASAETFVDGWYRSRDIVREHDGFYSYIGRANDYVKVNSSFVSMVEVEEELALIPEVDECVVIPYTDVDGATELRAHVIVKPDTSLTVGQIRTSLSKHLESHKVPRQILFVDSIPRTVTTKKIRNVDAYKM